MTGDDKGNIICGIKEDFLEYLNDFTSELDPSIFAWLTWGQKV